MGGGANYGGMQLGRGDSSELNRGGDLGGQRPISRTDRAPRPPAPQAIYDPETGRVVAFLTAGPQTGAMRRVLEGHGFRLRAE